MTGLTAAIRARMDKVRALMDSPNPGEAAAARARYADMQAKYGAKDEHLPAYRSDLLERVRQHKQTQQEWMEELADQAVDHLHAKGFAVFELNDGWYITPDEDVGRVLHKGTGLEALIILAATLLHVSESPA